MAFPKQNWNHLQSNLNWNQTKTCIILTLNLFPCTLLILFSCLRNTSKIGMCKRKQTGSVCITQQTATIYSLICHLEPKLEQLITWTVPDLGTPNRRRLLWENLSQVLCNLSLVLCKGPEIPKGFPLNGQ